MGPAQLEPGHGLDVRPHPHINLATVTYLFDGEIKNATLPDGTKADASYVSNFPVLNERGLAQAEEAGDDQRDARVTATHRGADLLVVPDVADDAIEARSLEARDERARLDRAGRGVAHRPRR